MLAIYARFADWSGTGRFALARVVRTVGRTPRSSERSSYAARYIASSRAAGRNRGRLALPAKGG
jgi:hypothetical protein